MFVTENLDLNVAWFSNILLNNHVVVVKALHGLVLCRLKLGHELRL